MLTPSNEWGPLPPHAPVPPPRRNLVWLERVLFLVGALAIGYYAYVTAEAYVYQAYETQQLDQILHSAPLPSATPGRTVAPRRPEPAPGSTVGRLDIPRLGVAAIVRAGSDARTLRLAVGHIDGTALPGEPGNVGLAGHRDTFFRQLRNIRVDDVIRIATTGGAYTYRVDRTNIVEPDDVWVLDQTPQSVLTLITCYPFTYIGAAPQRFVVRAHLEPVTRTADIQ